MAEPKQTTNAKGEPMHYSVGAVIKSGGKYLLIDRADEPLGFASIAGHMGEGETSEEALVRKVSEESGLRVMRHSLLFEKEVEWNLCKGGVSSHYWYVYACEVKGEARHNPEAAKTIGWYSPEEIRLLALEPVWKYWFEKMKII